jgi:hypothetical protein
MVESSPAARSEATPRPRRAARDDALAHLGRGLARERHRQHALRTFDNAEQREIPLDEELGLARTRPAPARETTARTSSANVRCAVSRAS